MSAPLIVIPLAIDWVILVTTLAPIFLPNSFSRRPQLGIAVWLAAFLSAGVATIGILVISIWAYLDTWTALNNDELGSQSWFAALLVSFVPWIALAAGGITLALINQKLEPYFEAAFELKPSLDQAKTFVKKFDHVPVYVIDLGLAFAVASRNQIIVSSYLVEHLSQEQLDAVLWHELRHVKQRHFLIKSLAQTIWLLSTKLTASRVMVLEVNRLLEIDADNFAKRHVSEANLRSARKLFS